MALLIGIGLIVLGYGIGYLLTTLLTWGVVALVNAIFSTHYDFNIWLLGLLVFIVLAVLKSIFSKK